MRNSYASRISPRRQPVRRSPPLSSSPHQATVHQLDDVPMDRAPRRLQGLEELPHGARASCLEFLQDALLERDERRNLPVDVAAVGAAPGPVRRSVGDFAAVPEHLQVAPDGGGTSAEPAPDFAAGGWPVLVDQGEDLSPALLRAGDRGVDPRLVQVEVFGAQVAVPGVQDARADEGVKELSHVSGPPGPLERLDRTVWNLLRDALPVPEVLDQFRDVLPSLRQRRHLDGQNVEPVEEVLHEESLAPGGNHIAVGGGDHPGGELNDLGATHSLEFMFLHDSQERRLGVERHVPDLVQEDGPVVGLLELADPALRCAGERALLMTEELAFDQGLGERRAVDRYERAAAPGTVMVDEAGDLFLARAAFAEKQDGVVALGHELGIPPELSHSCAAAHEVEGPS